MLIDAGPREVEHSSDIGDRAALLDEPAIATGIPTVLFATAAGVWNEPWLAFAAAASAGIGTLFVRTHSAPIHNG